MSATSRALWGVALSTCGNAVAYATAFRAGGAPRWAGLLFAVSSVMVLTALLFLGAQRGTRGLGPLRLPIALTALLLAGGFSAAVLLPPVTATSPLYLGLPAGAAIVVYGIGVIPMLILPVAYALTFGTETLTPEDLRRVRAARQTTPAHDAESGESAERATDTEGGRR
jgi:hypothetical protein